MNVDIQLLKIISQHRSESLNAFFGAITDSAALISFSIPVLVFIFSLLKKDRALRQKALLMIAALFSSTVVLNLLKYTVRRPRPFDTYPFIQKLTDGGGFSFPSGHTIDAFTIAGALVMCHSRWFIIIPAYVWAFLVAYSRMYLGVHYPSDVLAAALIASTGAFLCYKLSSYISREKDNKIPSRNNP